MRIDDEWYDLTEWKAAHPAGTHWIEAYNNSDATEVMYGFHSHQGLAMMTSAEEQIAAEQRAAPTRRPTPSASSVRSSSTTGGVKAWGEAKKLCPGSSIWVGSR